MNYREPSPRDDYEIRGGSVVRIVHDSRHVGQALVGWYEIRVADFRQLDDPPDTVRLHYGSLHGTTLHPKSDLVLVRAR